MASKSRRGPSPSVTAPGAWLKRISEAGESSSPVAFLLAEERGEALRDEALQRFKERASERKLPLEFFSLEETPLEDLLFRAENRPLFGGAQVFVVRRFEDLFTKEETRQSLSAYFASPAEWTHLLFVGTQTKEIKTLLSGASEACEVVLFRPLSTDALARSLAVLARSLGGGIKKEAAYALIERMGEDQKRLQQEVEKLALFKGEEPITLADVEESVEEIREHDLFEVLGAYTRRRAGEGGRLLRRVIKSESDAIAFAGLLAWRTRIVYEVSALQERGARTDEIARVLESRRVFGARQREFIDSASRTSTARLSRQFSALRELSDEIKYSRQKYGSGRPGDNSYATLPVERFLTAFSANF